jgi:hypothetical protein
VSLTKWDNLWQWGGIEDNELPKYLFSRKQPESIDEVEWRLVREVRKEMGDAVYDKKVRRLFTLIVSDPMVRYSDINAVWNKFMEIFMVFGSIVTYTEVWKDYYRQALQEAYDDGVQYLEFRGVLPEVNATKNSNLCLLKHRKSNLSLENSPKLPQSRSIRLIVINYFRPFRFMISTAISMDRLKSAACTSTFSRTSKLHIRILQDQSSFMHQ